MGDKCMTQDRLKYCPTSYRVSDTLNWSDITPICDSITKLDLITDFDLITNFGGFHTPLQRVRPINRDRLLLQTTGPVPFWNFQLF